MIGLGTNRLSASRLAGLGEVRQFRNGQWIEGVGSWFSPYSAAATAALKAAFPAQWATIRDYGWEHPEYVNAINLYAPQDAGIMGSLIPELNAERYLIGNGTAYIMTDIIVNTDSVMATKFINRYNLSNYPKVFGAYTSWNAADAFHLGEPSNGFKKVAAWIAGGDWPNCAVDCYTAHGQVLECTEIKVSGFKVKNWTTGDSFTASSGKTSVTGSKPIRIFGANGTWPYGEQNWKWEIAYWKHERNGVTNWFIPCVHDNKKGMLDVGTAIFYEDATGNNGFTISESPS